MRLKRVPKVSVSMITYNHEKFIGQAIQSVLAQQFDQDLEIVIGEDCSTDKTRQVIQDYASQTPGKFVMRLHDQNVGMMANLLDVYDSCSGDYIAFLEGDDYWTDSTKLARQAEFMDANPAYSMCFHQSEKVDRTGKSLKSFHPVSSPAVLGLEDIIACNPIQTNSILLRRSMLVELPTFLQRLKLGDWPICILLAMKGPIGYFDRPMSAYRIHPQSAWSSKSHSFHRRAVAHMYIALAAEYPELEPRICDAIIQELNTIESSLSYKLGFMLTAPIRWLADSRFLR